MRSRRLLTFVTLVCISITLLLVYTAQPALAFVEQYFSYSYSFSFSKTAVAGSEVFYVTVSGQANCIKDLPLPVSQASIVSKVVAKHQQSGAEVVLNARYSMSYSTFPTKKGESVSESVRVPLSFPGGSAGGTYTVTGYILEAKVKISILPALNVANEFPSSEVMGTVTYQPAGSGGDGGGSGGGLGGLGVVILSPIAPIPATDLSTSLDENGVFKEEAEAKSVDKSAKLVFPKGTRFKTSSGDIGTGVVMLVVEKGKEPQAPAGGVLIGQVYTMGPEGATFDPPIKMTVAYEEALLPENVREKDLVIAWWNTATEKWENLKDCRIDVEADTVTGSVEHFTVFSLIGKQATPEFDYSSLTIRPALARPDEAVTVAVDVTNSGSGKGTTGVILKINGIEESKQEITLQPGAGQTVSFTVSRKPAALYRVEVNGLNGSFSIGVSQTAPATTAAPSSTKPQAKPAVFTIGELTIMPSATTPADTVTVTVRVRNEGDLSGTHELTIKLDGQSTESRSLTLAGKTEETVTFILSGTTAGDHIITVNELSGKVTVNAPVLKLESPQKGPTSGWLVGGLTVAGLVALGGTVAYIILRRKGTVGT